MIKTIKLKDLLKYLVGLILIILISICSTRYFSSLNETKIFSLFDIDYTAFIKSNLTIASLEKKSDVVIQDAEKYTSRSGVTRILGMELPNIEEKEEEKVAIADNKSDEAEEDEKEPEREVGQLKETYTNKYGSVKIKNDTDIKLTESILKPDYNVKNTKDVIIFHTHTCESYTPTKENKYKASGNFRTTDLNYSVAKVGDTLKKYLTEYKFNVIHNKSVHDYPAYSGSYNRSLKTVRNALKESKSDIIIDLHRDAIGSNSKYAPTVKIGEDYCAQLMFVIGTNRRWARTW